MHLFISHPAKDAALVKSLRSRLDKAGIDVLDPENDLSKGNNVPLAVGRALERADAMLVLLSPDAVRSDWLRWELEYALGDERFKDRLVPVLVRPTNDLPWILRRLSVVDVTKDHPPRALEKIVDAVSALGNVA